jgi:sporulation protein YabP
MEDVKTVTKHTIAFSNRKDGTITGVTDVISFDMNTILLETGQGMLTIKGTELHIGRLDLDKGEAEVDGHIDGLIYSEIHGGRKNGKSLLGRMFG